MFSSMWTKQFARAACLLCGVFMCPAAFAGPIITPSEIDGTYEANFGNAPSPQPLPFSFTLEDGRVNTPSNIDLNSLLADDITVSEKPKGGNPPGVTVTMTDLILSGTVLGQSNTIDYTIDAPQLQGANVIVSEVTLNPLNTSLTTIDLVNLNPALLTVTFSSGVNLGPDDPSWTSNPSDVTFTITELPEPASVVYLGWVGALAGISSWRRRRPAMPFDRSN